MIVLTFFKILAFLASFSYKLFSCEKMCMLNNLSLAVNRAWNVCLCVCVCFSLHVCFCLYLYACVFVLNVRARASYQ